MVVGFNHNIRYKGELFHVQTEDSGRANPHIITLLYRGGTIISSAKTSYADILKTDQLEVVVEAIMKDQHKDMMRRLKGGEFDARIFPNGAPAGTNDSPSPAGAPPAPSPARPEPVEALTAQAAAPVQAGPGRTVHPDPVEGGTAQTVTATPSAPVVPPAPKESPAKATAAAPEPTVKRSLDEVILDYLITGEE